VGGREPLDVEKLLRENANLREQRQAVDEVLRAVARPEGLQPVLDAIISAARRLCHGEHGRLYLAEGDVFVIDALGARVGVLADSTATRFDVLAARIDARFDRVDARFDHMDERFDALAARLDAHLDHHPT